MLVKLSENIDEDYGVKVYRVWYRVLIIMYLFCGLYMYVLIYKN